MIHRAKKEVENSLKKYSGVEGVDYAECKLCGLRGTFITNTHLKNHHNITPEEYSAKFPNSPLISEAKIKIQKDNALKQAKGFVNVYNKSRMIGIDAISESFKDEGYQLLTKEYKNNKQKLEYVCPNRHQRSISWNSWSKGRRCRVCAVIEGKFGSGSRLDVSALKSGLAAEGYELLSSEYKNNRDTIVVRCPEGHIFDTSWFHWKTNEVKCLECAPAHRSQGEDELYEFIKLYKSDALQRVRNIISPKELDIYIPSENLGIEYCGLFHHSEQRGKDQYYHKDKLDRCFEQDIDLITIFEDEWVDKKAVVKSRLLNKMQISESVSVYARKCKIEEIDVNTKNEFLNKFHLQGADICRVSLGAFLGDRLVSVMTFAVPSISKGMVNLNDGKFELRRFCSDYELNVVGVASKLFQYFIKKYNPTEVLTYGDLRWSRGDLYQKLGFHFVKITKPNFFFVRGNKRYHRFRLRKSELIKKMNSYNHGVSAVQNAIDAGYLRIFDCGHVLWRWSNED